MALNGLIYAEPRAGFGVVRRTDPVCFLAGCCTRRLNQVFCVSYLSMLYILLLIIRAPFYVSLVFVAMCSVFWLFWLSCQYLPSDWVERLLCGSLTVARGSSPESPGRRVLMIFLVYCIVSLFYYVSVLSPGPCDIFSYSYIARYSLFVPLNTKQTNKQILYTLKCRTLRNYSLTDAPYRPWLPSIGTWE